MKIRMLQLSKANFFLFFNKFHLVLICLFELKMRENVKKYVVCCSNN